MAASVSTEKLIHKLLMGQIITNAQRQGTSSSISDINFRHSQIRFGCAVETKLVLNVSSSYLGQQSATATWGLDIKNTQCVIICQTAYPFTVEHAAIVEIEFESKGHR
mgnify:FL=1